MVVTGSGVAVVLKYVAIGLPYACSWGPKGKGDTIATSGCKCKSRANGGQKCYAWQSVETVTDKLPMATVIVFLCYLEF